MKNSTLRTLHSTATPEHGSPPAICAAVGASGTPVPGPNWIGQMVAKRQGDDEFVIKRGVGFADETTPEGFRAYVLVSEDNAPCHRDQCGDE